MGSEYDRKFEEMKKYIPFLESMIKRLESNSSSASNPRQAQLDKIRSLRDLLLDKKKRMKMDNLLKCEQVLVNLYAKVEQRDPLPVVKEDKMDCRSSNDNDLEAVRNKLKTVVKMHNITETLPEIARASEKFEIAVRSELEETCEPGSKEPALFQRRPNRSSISPTIRSPKKSHDVKMTSKSQSKRYTRVLVSPEPKSSRWPVEETSTENQLFSRRSPKTSPKKTSPSYHKKERKKSSKSKERKSRKDLNITLKVPEESLHSLNTEDILSRIITCSDGDVDIDTLRELRSQILGELKQTGTNEDISDLILKSYNKKSKSRKKKRFEVEDGEISDSESEAIENIYGSLIVMDKDKKPGQVKKASEKSNQQRKIQICLVINADKEGEDAPPTEIDLAESGAFESNTENKDVICLESDASPSPTKLKDKNESPIDDASTNNECKATPAETIPSRIPYPIVASGENKDGSAQSTLSHNIPVKQSAESSTVTSITPTKNKGSPNTSEITPTKIIYSPSLALNSPSPDKKDDENISETTKNIANFYNSQPENVDKTPPGVESDKDSDKKSEDAIEKVTREQHLNENKTGDSTEIPLLNEPTLPPKAKKDVLSEIDILQALKNEILSETIPIVATEIDTPALHQPKITKVASAGVSSHPKTIKVASSSGMTKKRISIENYKKKSETVAKSLFVRKRSNAARDERKKQSLKLTEKECERFNLPRLSLDDDTDDISDDDLLDDDKPLSLEDIYADLAPKSPDEDNFCNDLDDSPVLIPVDPVKTAVVTSKTDIDMRNLPTSPKPLPVPPPIGFTNVVSPTINADMLKSPPMHEPNKILPDGNRKIFIDPRLRRDVNQVSNKDSPNLYGTTNFEGTPRSSQFPNIPSLLSLPPVFAPSYAPSMTPIRTPNARSYDMTPTHQCFEIEEQQKHVYAPSFSMCDNRDRDFSGAKERPIWETNKLLNLNDNQRSGKDPRNARLESYRDSPIQRESLHNYNPRNDQYHIDRRDSYSNMDCPSTPVPSFGWADGSHTAGSSFGRREIPMSPSYTFGKSDGSATPNHSFGRSECPPTPSHSFGRSECPPTPNHPFGRSDMKDPRVNRRQSDYESRIHHDHDGRDRGYQNDRNYNRNNSFKSHNKAYGESDSPRNYDRDQSIGKNDRYSNEQGNRYSKSSISDPHRRFEKEQSFGRKDQNYSNDLSVRGFGGVRREPSLNRSLQREDSNRLFTRTGDIHYDDSRYSDNHEEMGSRRNQREKSIGRTMPEESTRASRGSSIGRSEYNNSLSVKPQAGHSFTIDTSVKATFQNLFESGKGIKVFDYSFDARRQRASSVGRSLGRESSVGRTLFHEAKLREANLTDSACLQRRNNFRRASSVGRTLVGEKNERSFKEIKADFESYRLNFSKNITKIANKKSNIKKDTSESNLRSSRKEEFDKQIRSAKQNAKQQYSPRKNHRDPRMRKDQKDFRNKNDRGHSWDRRHSGIVYSNDNIAKGTIMGTGFGVKNYKIPKIKRPEPERPKTPVESIIKESDKVKTSTTKIDTCKNIKSSAKKDKNKNSDDDVSEKNKIHSVNKSSVEKSNDKKENGNNSDDSDDLKNKKKVTKLRVSKMTNISDDDSEKRVTRSSKKSDSFNVEEEPFIKKSKRIRKAIIDDSDSDVETEIKPKNETSKLKPIINKDPDTNPEIIEVFTKRKQIDESVKSMLNKKPEAHKLDAESEASSAEKELRKTLEEDSLDSSFGIDDLGIFSENIVSDPVIGNINDLIADLDNDLGAAKSGNDSFTSEMVKIMGAIDSQEENTLGDISELIEKDLNESNEKLKTDAVELVSSPNTAMPIVAVVESDKEHDLLKSDDIAPEKMQDEKPTTFIEQPTDLKGIVHKITQRNDTNKSEISTAGIDEIVSTTHTDQFKSNSNKGNNNICADDKTERANNDQSTPDSTIIQNDDVPSKSEESIPDSTMDIHSEVSSDVTSTLNDPEKCLRETTEPTSSRKEISAIESFGSLLSILQDKSKIRELLSMLGDQTGESEKLKKKLEKLSEIVSDEEDTNEDQSDILKTLSDSQTNKEPELTKTPKELESANENECVKQSGIIAIAKTVDETGIEKIKQHGVHDDTKDAHPTSKEECSASHLEEENVANKTEESTDLISQSNDSERHDDHTYEDNNDEMESINQDDEANEELKKVVSKKTKMTRRGKGRGRRGRANPKRGNKPIKVKVQELKPKIQKKTRNRELQTLQNDIKEMFMRDEVLNATGIRMCRLAKMVSNKGENASPPKDVLLEKSESMETLDEPVKKIRKKPGPKPKPKIVSETNVLQDKSIDKLKSYKPGPKSRTKQKHEAIDPYEFESDSVADTNTTKESDVNSSDSDSGSLASSGSIGSSEVLADIKKKPKKKRGAWQIGIIKPKHRKKKNLDSSTDRSEIAKRSLPIKPVTIPDMNCFTDKMYYFQRGVFTYDCRLCHYSGTEIVNHYKKQHAHTEIPLSRMDPDTARKAIQQCADINFQAISKIPSEKYTCRFCYKEFSRNRVALESFFWHVVSTHTGEFKHLCYECVNITRCPFNLDIPPPPKEIKGQLIGYICGKCNFTQISLENLKTHVIVRHDDEQTAVYTINLGVMSQKAMTAMLRKSFAKEQPRTLRSSRSNQSIIDVSDERSEIIGSDRMSDISTAIPKLEKPDPHTDRALAKLKSNIRPGLMKSKLRFETDDQEGSDETSVKQEESEHEADYPNETSLVDNSFNKTALLDETGKETSLLDTTDPKCNTVSDVPEPRETTDVFDQPHFKLNYKDNGSKEYVCCVKGVENHYKTTLLISIKKHVQTKHSENWDGYCCLCKVIVTLQGVQSSFKDCLTHFLDKHMDDFPVMEKDVENTNEDSRSFLRTSIDASTIERTESPRTYIAVRPLSDLMSKDVDDVDPPLCDDSETAFPIIENVISLGDQTEEVPQASPIYPSTSSEVLSEPIKQFQYEEVQAEVMSRKHRIVLDTMMQKEMLVRVFKCAGRFCSFTTDSAEDALVHASAHKQMGGEGALGCAYCNFDAAGNAIDIVMHVFKEHGRCQYSCMLCFYRAAADQLVSAHFMQAHGSTGPAAKVLRSTAAVAPAVVDSSNMLPRETAVPFYICNHGKGSCKFRTYTPGKFCEHLQQKHSSEESHPCNLCEVTMSTPKELVKHLKSHDVKLYQCTWCVHGANTESEMLSHAASMHPTKNPQAYLRIITNKDGSMELRVLPLIYLNKLKAPIEDVIPSKAKENPTREAERSIELEKLIKQTTLRLETESDNLTTRSIPNISTPKVIEAPTEIIAKSADLPDVQTVEATQQSVLLSPEKQLKGAKEPADSVIKNEPEEVRSVNQRTDIVVYCLDSDEEGAGTAQTSVTEDESAKLNVIDLSDEEPAEKSDRDHPTLMKPISETCSSQTAKEPTISEKPKFKKVNPDLLFICPSCNLNSKNVGGFKRHTNSCCLELSTIRCPHAPCPIVLSNITQLINHYNKDHNVQNIAKQYYCGICKSRWSTLNVTKKHLKEAHGIFKATFTSKIGNDGICAFTVDKEIRPTRELPKRKTSVETPKKYGIDDIDKLPINPIMDNLVYCNICEFSTKVRLNMVRHLQLHAERQPVPQTEPVNPVPHLETNEKHFDKMVNLASSSAATRADKAPAVAMEADSRYPKYVPDRQRHTCGAKGCSYISLDEDMLRCHWQTLHSEAVDYHCVHCPPHQHLDTSKMLTATRIIAHLKMHDVNLYACPVCTYYHYKKQIVERHIADVHKDKGGQVQVVREDGTNTVSVSQLPGSLGTMDLKPWQCGLCQFKSMLRQSVVEHCSIEHQTKMQFKCAYCPFRTSAIENIVKHQSNAHPTKEEDVFYYYYREGTLPNEADGTTRWQKQRQKSGLQDTLVKTELEPGTSLVQAVPVTVPIDLNLVKKEVENNVDSEMSVEDLCKRYGQFCEPNGISFKCSLCKAVSEYTREAMQSHLYEELKYRRWSCAICAYKAYHRAGLNDHIASEHSRNFIEPSELPVNVNIEKWVSKLLDHQAAIIEKNKINNKQKTAAEKPQPVAGPSKVVEPPKPVQPSSDSELEQAFGTFGAPKDDSYCCPKCKILLKDEDEMRNHLESELTKIRWCCTKCTDKFPTFHEAQFHCKSHPGLLSRPKEAIRDPSLRSAWISTVVNTQKKTMMPILTAHVADNIDLSDASDNSLLVVRYEEAAPTEEQLREIARKEQLRETTRKRPAQSDSDDEDGLVIHEPESKKLNVRHCPYCEFVSKSNSQYKLCMKEHVLRHYNLKILTCVYCSFNGTRKGMYRHLQTEHPGMHHQWKQTEIPNVLPSEYNIKLKHKDKRAEDETLPRKVCLHCEAAVLYDDMITHLHGNKPTEFGDRGDVVVKCCICLTLRSNLETMQVHYNEAHPDITKMNYAYFKLKIDTREVHACGICNRRFSFLRDLRIHHSAMHGTFNLSYNTVPYRPEEDDHETRGKRKLDTTPQEAKRIAKKSTSKLPNSHVAKKSTTKLPNSVDSRSDSDGEYSYYGTKPSSIDKYENVKTKMAMCNTVVEIDVKKLSGILKIDPKVVVNDCEK